jgi:hypothetical protein
LKGNGNGYTGQYYSTWREDRVPLLAGLEITHKPDTNNKIFTLEWRGISNPNSNFDGEGMLCDDILIGNYWSVK